MRNVADCLLELIHNFSCGVQTRDITIVEDCMVMSPMKDEIPTSMMEAARGRYEDVKWEK